MVLAKTKNPIAAKLILPAALAFSLFSPIVGSIGEGKADTPKNGAAVSEEKTEKPVSAVLEKINRKYAEDSAEAEAIVTRYFTSRSIPIDPLKLKAEAASLIHEAYCGTLSLKSCHEANVARNSPYPPYGANDALAKDAFGNDNISTRIWSLELLKSRMEKLLPYDSPGKLVRLLRNKDSDAELRTAAVYALGENKGKFATSTLLQLVDSCSTVGFCYETSTALNKMNDAASVDTLIQASLHPRSYQVQEAALNAIGKIGDRRAMPALVKIMATPALQRSTGTYCYAGDALAKIDVALAADVVLGHLRSGAYGKYTEYGGLCATKAFFARENRGKIPELLKLTDGASIASRYYAYYVAAILSRHHGYYPQPHINEPYEGNSRQIIAALDKCKRLEMPGIKYICKWGLGQHMIPSDFQHWWIPDPFYELRELEEQRDLLLFEENRISEASRAFTAKIEKLLKELKEIKGELSKVGEIERAGRNGMLIPKYIYEEQKKINEIETKLKDLSEAALRQSKEEMSNLEAVIRKKGE